MQDRRDYLKDEDWWGESAPARKPAKQQKRPKTRSQVLVPPQQDPYAARRLEKRRREKTVCTVLKYITIVMFAVFVFVQVSRFAFIAGNTQQIATLESEISDLRNAQSNLHSRLSVREDIKRVRDEATYNLGMRYPAESQLRVLSSGVQLADTGESGVASAAQNVG